MDIYGNFQNGFNEMIKYALFIDNNKNVSDKLETEYRNQFYGIILESVQCSDDYNVYKLFKNNCLHFVLNLLRMGDIYNDLVSLYVGQTKTIIPNVFYHGLLLAKSLRNNWWSKMIIKARIKVYC